ncbi:hypothetical protein GUITHDRAFT_121938 [Guillardia theta CCMP2712]|uniref:SET domain-containing protein n=2 Tax=Guillardia theta TaxID=55529 RepID=L1I7K7_GUITC|nr:hypothetical protein GUITHDRAFT_121938 [Guillardia theta CCMP2712]EKX31864.1 hypothetical protein GUITHDRAFT_121938 [Guillardia theta CCMP2712]|eukprot:XP_005818844.1 hypothetical protein GUITHDRAFT_121938 [Guillardia theta CCMP2712]
MRLTVRGVRWLRRGAEMVEEVGGGKGRGFLARTRIEEGELMLKEQPIRGRSLEELARQVMEDPKLVRVLHAPLKYERKEVPKDLRQRIDEEGWSRIVAQSSLNGFRNARGDCVLARDASAFNHSCKPNAAIYPCPTSDDVQVRALRQIRTGQEIAICYDSTLYALPKAMRRQELLHRWGFECDCPRCLDQEDKVDKMLEAMKGGGSQGPEGATRLVDLELGVSHFCILADELCDRESPPLDELRSLAGRGEKLLAELDGEVAMTHWLMLLMIHKYSLLLWHLLQRSSLGTEGFDPDLGNELSPLEAKLRSILRLGMAAERQVFPSLHPRRLLLYSMWDTLPDLGETWKTTGVLDDLEAANRLWNEREE